MIKLGSEWANKFPEDAILCFFGDLGAGKTTFIKGLMEGRGVDKSRVSSPTFVYMNIYEGQKPAYHFDLYRLKGSEEFLSMGFDEYLFSPGLKCIEWSEKIADILPQDVIKITITHLAEGREIEVLLP